MVLTGKLKETYIPRFLNNTELEENEQIQTQILHPTLEDRELLASDIIYKDGQSGPEIQVKTKHCKIVKKCIGKIENLETRMDGKIHSGKELSTAKDPRLEPLIEELALYIKKENVLEGEGEKN